MIIIRRGMKDFWNIAPFTRLPDCGEGNIIPCEICTEMLNQYKSRKTAVLSDAETNLPQPGH